MKLGNIGGKRGDGRVVQPGPPTPACDINSRYLGEIVPDYRSLHLGRRFAHCQQVFETVRAEGCEVAEKVNGLRQIYFALRVFTDN